MIDNKSLGELFSKSLDLINRQKAEIERLTKALDEQYESCIIAMDICKAEAVKAFAERLCEDRVSNDPVVIATKCLVKEFTEGEQK